MGIFFGEIILDNEGFEFGFLFFLKKKILFLNAELTRKIIIFIKTIPSLFWSSFFSKNRLIIGYQNKNPANIIGFDYQDWLGLEFFVKNIFLKIISPVSLLNFFLQILKTKNKKNNQPVLEGKKFDNYTMWEISSKDQDKNTEGGFFLQNFRTGKIFNGFFIKTNRVFLSENPLISLVTKTVFAFPYLPFKGKERHFMNLKNSFQIKLQKKKIFLYNFKRPLLFFQCYFDHFRGIWFQTIFLNCQQRVTFCLFPLNFSEGKYLKKIEFSFLSRNFKKYENDIYFFKRNHKLFNRKIFSTKLWLVWVILSHQAKGTPLKITETYTTF